MFNIEQLQEDASCFVVAKELGVNITKKGRRYLILCPNHPDRRIGSCFLDAKGYKCYSCNHRGNVFDFVMKTKGISFMEAVETVAEICGGAHLYETTRENGKENIKYIIPSRFRDMIGLKDSPIYGTVAIFGTKEEADDYIISNPGAAEDFVPTIGYVVTDLLCGSPLAEIYMESKDEYLRLVDEHLLDTFGSTRNIYWAVYKKSNDPAKLLHKFQQELETLSFISEHYGTGKLCKKCSNEILKIKAAQLNMQEIGTGAF